MVLYGLYVVLYFVSKRGTGLDFVRCPGCLAMVWEDLHALVKGVPARFRCIRCNHIIKLGNCSVCGNKKWERMPDITEKESKKPVVRFKCGGCKRIIGILLD